jgi:hypothetical protein
MNSGSDIAVVGNEARIHPRAKAKALLKKGAAVTDRVRTSQNGSCIINCVLCDRAASRHPVTIEMRAVSCPPSEMSIHFID